MLGILKEYNDQSNCIQNCIGKVNHNLELKQWIMDNSKDLAGDITMSERIYFVLNGKSVCPYDSDRKFLTFTRGYGYCGKADYCQCCCDKSTESIWKLRRKTDEERAEIIAQRLKTIHAKPKKYKQKIKAKRKKTLKDKYGIENPMDSKEFKDKKKTTNL